MKTLAEACQKTGWLVHAYCLMRNHFHFVLETPDPNSYTIRLNRRHDLVGHLFSGRYKSPLVESTADEYFKAVCDYVHLNPVRAALLKPEDTLLAYPWTSLGWYAAAREHRPPWIYVDRLFETHGIPGDTPSGRAEFQLRMNARRAEETDEATLKQIRQSWCFGSTTFKEELLQRVEGQLGEHHSGLLRREGPRRVPNAS